MSYNSKSHDEVQFDGVTDRHIRMRQKVRHAKKRTTYRVASHSLSFSLRAVNFGGYGRVFQLRGSLVDVNVF